MGGFNQIAKPRQTSNWLKRRKYEYSINSGRTSKGERGRQYAKKSESRYRFKGQPNIQGMKTALMVYDHLVANPKIRLWEAGKILPQFKMELEECEKKSIVPSYDLKRTIEVTVSRYKRKATSLITNAELGLFP